MIVDYTLECIGGKRKGQLYRFPGCGVIRIGRKKDCDIPVPDPTVSSEHCTLTCDGMNILLHDHHSTNGTQVDGQRVKDASLQDGDILTLGGSCSFRLSVRYGVSEEDDALIDSIVKTLAINSKSAEDAPSAKAPQIEPHEEKALCRCEICGKEFPADQREEELDICPHCMEYEEEAVMRFLLADTPSLNKENEANALQLSGYRRLRKLGEGSFGAVWLVEEEATGRHMALKTMLESAMLLDIEQKKFDREMDIASRLHHPNIVAIYQVGCANGRFYMLQEYCAGGSLMSYLERTYYRFAGKLPVHTALHIALQLLDALDYAHHLEIRTQGSGGTQETVHGVVHRDIHPGNIFLADRGDSPIVKLGDWGLSKAFETAGLSGISVGNVPTGTRDFACMQQHINFRYCGPEVDVWSAAAVLFFLLTGKSPREKGLFGFKNAAEAFPPAQPVRRFRPDLSSALGETIDYTLSEHPRLRVTSAKDLKERLLCTPEGKT